jgi:hypothetical protein
VYKHHIISALPPYGENLSELQEEAKLLSELIGVLDIREEQLLELVEKIGIARDNA